MKHFTSGNLINLMRVDWEKKKLDEILAQDSPANQDTLGVIVSLVMQICTKEEEEKQGGNLSSLPRHVIINFFLCKCCLARIMNE